MGDFSLPHQNCKFIAAHHFLRQFVSCDLKVLKNAAVFHF